MNYNKKMNLCIGLLLVLLTACQGAKKEVETQTPRISVSEYAMLHEVVKIKLDNVAPDMEVTVDFGDGTVETGRNNGLLTHAYTKEGDYTIKAQTATGTLAAGIHVCNLPALSVAMQQFKDPSYKKVWVMAHRAHTQDKTIPENSLSAIEAAVAAGAEILECDVRHTKDGVLVVCHDETIDATTTGQGRIADMTYDEILQYNLKDRAGKPTDEKMPTLEEFLKAGRGKIYFNLDYSPRTASTQEVMNVVKELDMMEQVFFYCNSSQKAEEVLSISKKAHVYTWAQSAYKPLVGLPGNYFVQYSYAPDGQSTPIGTAVSEGMIPTVNMLHVLSGLIPEYDINTTYLDELLQIYPEVRMIQTDAPEVLISALQARGLR